MRRYQLAMVLKISLSAVQRKKIITTIKEWLKGLKLVKEEELGEKQLSYKIKKESAGFYMDFLFEGETVIPQDFERRLLANDSILRHLLIRKK